MNRPLPPISPEDKMYAGLCYLFWFIVPFFLYYSRRREDHFICFSCIQGFASGLVLFVFSVFVVLCAAIVSKILVVLAQSYYVLLGFVGLATTVAILLYFIFALGLQCFWAWRAYHGEYFEIPKIGPWAWAKTVEINGPLPSADYAPKINSHSTLRDEEPQDVFSSMGVDPIGQGRVSQERQSRQEGGEPYREVKKVTWGKVNPPQKSNMPEVFQKKSTEEHQEDSIDEKKPKPKNIKSWRPPSA